MGLREWLGFSKPRDAPTEKLPEVTDNVRDSGGLFIYGRAESGERVDEKSALQIATVYACVRLLAETVASLPLHLYRYTDKGDGKERAADHPLYKLLYRQPNLEMTSFSFREAMMTHLLLWGNAYAQIVRDGKNGVLGLYPLLPGNVEIDRAENGELYYIYHAYTDEVPGEHDKDILLMRDEVLHIPGLGFNGLVGFSPIAMMKNSLGTTLVVEKYGSAFIIDFDFIVGADGVKIFEPIETIIVGKFLKFILEFYSIGLDKVGGYSRHYKFIKNKAFPIPPLAEQKRIVAKIEELLPLCERLK